MAVHRDETYDTGKFRGYEGIKEGSLIWSGVWAEWNGNNKTGTPVIPVKEGKRYFKREGTANERDIGTRWYGAFRELQVSVYLESRVCGKQREKIKCQM